MASKIQLNKPAKDLLSTNSLPTTAKEGLQQQGDAKALPDLHTDQDSANLAQSPEFMWSQPLLVHPTGTNDDTSNFKLHLYNHH